MNSTRRILGTLCRWAYGAWCRACLRQAGQLNCNPSGLIAGLAVMVGVAEIWSHRRDVDMWIFLLGVPAAIAVITLTIVKFLETMTVKSWPTLQQQPAVQQRPARVREIQPEIQPGPVPGHVEVPDEAVELADEHGIVVLHPDGVERIEETERIGVLT